MPEQSKVYDFTAVSPESLGISSEGIIRFIEELAQREIFAHSFILMRHGKVAAECYYSPWKADTLQRLYSSSKSFAAIAIGFLADEGKVSLNDPIWKFFPEYPPETLHPYTRGATIYDALTMQLCFSRDSYLIQNDGHWIESFFRAEPDHPCGLVWRYDTCAAQMLAEIVRRVTGMRFYEYLRTKLPYAGYLEKAFCVTAPDGSDFAGSGLRVTTRDFALTAELMCAGGRLDGIQYLSEDFVHRATTPQSWNYVDGIATISTEGYGFQLWCGKDCFMFKGMANQFGVCFPKSGVTFVINCNTRGNGSAYEITYTALVQHVLKNMADIPLPENPQAEERLRALTQNAQVTLMGRGAVTSLWENKLRGQTYSLNGKAGGVTRLQVNIQNGEGEILYTNETGNWRIEFGMGKRKPFLFTEHHPECDFTGPTLTPEYTCVGQAYWVRENQLCIRIDFEGQYMGNMIWTLGFRDNDVALYIHHDLDMFPNRWFLNRYEGYGGGTLIGNGQ